MKKTKVILILGLLMSVSLSSICFATESSKITSNNNKIDDLKEEKEQLEDEKDAINSEILELIEKMGFKQEEIDSVQKKIDLLQKEIDELQNSINETVNEIKTIENKISENEKIYKEKEKEQEYQEEVLSNRVKRNYMNDTYNEFLGIILDSESLSEILFKVKYVNDIMNNDKKVISELKETKLMLAQTKESLDKDKEDLSNHKLSLEYQQEVIKEKQENVVEERKVLDAEMAELNNLEIEKQAKINKIISTQKNIDSQIQDLTVENANLTAILQETSSSSSGVSYGSGTFINPTSGRYTSDYGWRTHPITGKRSFHSGQDIANSYGTPIVAADGGKVVKASYYGAYGNTVIVDHGNNYSTMYAHLQSFKVSVGDTVSQGQQLGEMGSTGWSTGPHLHYEVWYNGEHMNPRQFLK